MPWPLGKPRSAETNAKVGRPGRKHPDDCAHCAALRGRPSGNSGKRRSFTAANEYKRVHHLVRKARGVPGPCQTCDEQNSEWALNHDAPTSSFRILENGLPVSDDPDDYIPLCRGCHNRFDHKEGRNNALRAG